MSKRGTKLYLEDIKNSIRKIEKYTRGVNFDEFSRDEEILWRTIQKDLPIFKKQISKL